MKVTCRGSGYLLQRCTTALMLVEHFIVFIFSSPSWLYPCSRFPAQPPAHTVAHITHTKCICSHSYKVGSQLPFRQPEIFSLQLLSTATDSTLPQWLHLPLPLEGQHFWRNHLQYFRYNNWSLTSRSSYLKASEWYHTKQSLILAWLPGTQAGTEETGTDCKSAFDTSQP